MGGGGSKEITKETVGVRMNEFAFKLLPRLIKSDKVNVFVSPFSILSALGMLGVGATEGSDHVEELEKVTGIPFSHESSQDIYAMANDAITKSEKGVEILVANSAWVRKAVLDSFKKEIAETFDANAYELTTADPINKWVSEKTKAHIPSIIEKIEQDDIAVLINAIYFQASWSKQFQESNTKKEKFVLEGEEKPVMCNMMHQTNKMMYNCQKAFDMVGVPYGESGRLVACVFVPKKGYTADSVCEDMTAEGFQTLMTEAKEKKVDLKMPRFKLEYGVKSLNGELQDLGMKASFSQPGGFLKLAEDPSVMVTKVMHKAVLEVNEAGTVAAAVTAVMLGRGFDMEEPVNVHVNKPFIFAITDKSSGAIIFLGKIDKPEFL